MKIKKDMTFGEVFDKNPEKIMELANVMMKHGLHCVGCHVASWETIEQGAKTHGMEKKEMDKMLDELNQIANTKSKRKD